MEQYKQDFINHIKGDKPTSSHDLWVCAKEYFTIHRGFIMGGSYDTMLTNISISLRETKESELIRFRIDLNEL